MISDQHLKRIEAFNTRAENPTHWNEIVVTGPDYLERALASRPMSVRSRQDFVDVEPAPSVVTAAIPASARRRLDRPRVLLSCMSVTFLRAGVSAPGRSGPARAKTLRKRGMAGA